MKTTPICGDDMAVKEKLIGFIKRIADSGRNGEFVVTKELGSVEIKFFAEEEFYGSATFSNHDWSIENVDDFIGGMKE